MKKETISRIKKFTIDRDWDQFHSPANLAKSISIEASELLECFQWNDDNYDLEAVKEELADVIVYCVDMVEKLGLDVDEIINAKMDKNEAKYPVDSAFTEKSDDKSNIPLKILMIDDNKDLANILCELISYLGYETLFAHNGTEGIAKARALRPDVIICDIGLPDISGIEVAKMIRKDAEHKDIFLIALSGYVQREDIDRSIEAGFDRHLGKPVTLETLQMVLNEISMSDAIAPR